MRDSGASKTDCWRVVRAVVNEVEDGSGCVGSVILVLRGKSWYEVSGGVDREIDRKMVWCSAMHYWREEDEEELFLGLAVAVVVIRVCFSERVIW